MLLGTREWASDQFESCGIVERNLVIALRSSLRESRE